MIKGCMDYCMQHQHTKVITIYTKNKAVGIKFDYTTHKRNGNHVLVYTEKLFYN